MTGRWGRGAHIKICWYFEFNYSFPLLPVINCNYSWGPELCLAYFGWYNVQAFRNLVVGRKWRKSHRLVPPHCTVTSSDFAHERCSLADVCFVGGAGGGGGGCCCSCVLRYSYPLVSTFVAKKESVDSEVANVRFNIYRVCDMSRKTCGRSVLNLCLISSFTESRFRLRVRTCYL